MNLGINAFSFERHVAENGNVFHYKGYLIKVLIMY